MSLDFWSLIRNRLLAEKSILKKPSGGGTEHREDKGCKIKKYVVEDKCHQSVCEVRATGSEVCFFVGDSNYFESLGLQSTNIWES